MKLSDASAIYLGSELVDRIYLGSNQVWPVETTDPAYGTGVYGPPLTITTAAGSGPYTEVSRRRIGVLLEELETNYLNVGEPYRIDWDVVAADPGVILKVDWCDVSPYFEQVVEAGRHYGHESQGRVGGYSSTYRFTDFEPVGGSITFTNVTIRRIYEFGD